MTKYGRPQTVVFPALVLTAMLVFLIAALAYLPAWPIVAIEVLLAALLIWILTFFRDPYRTTPTDRNVLLAPADGKVTNIENVEENDFIDGPALRIGIFLSILDVHINRAPCNVRVEEVAYKPGKYRNAMNPESGRVNESNDLYLVRTDSPQDKLIVRQISGAIARRIVCATRQGQELSGGQQFGMIKFGSRTELYLTARENAKCLVRIGDKVKAGLSFLVRYE